MSVSACSHNKLPLFIGSQESCKKSGDTDYMTAVSFADQHHCTVAYRSLTSPTYPVGNNRNDSGDCDFPVRTSLKFCWHSLVESAGKCWTQPLLK